MTALPCDAQIWSTAAPVGSITRGTRPKASLMLMLRGLDDMALAALESEIAVYQRTGVVCQMMTRFLDD